MIFVFEKGLAALLALLMMLPAAALSETETERITVLESRLAELEALLKQVSLESEPAEPVDVAVGEPITLAQGLTITLDDYETVERFRYYPAGGYSATTLLAKAGYNLLCLAVTVDNETSKDIHVATLLDATLSLGQEYTAQARHSFFYLAQPDVYTGGLKCVTSGTTVEGCLLFAVPDWTESSTEPLALRLDFAGEAYVFTLRQGESEEP